MCAAMANTSQIQRNTSNRKSQSMSEQTEKVCDNLSKQIKTYTRPPLYIVNSDILVHTDHNKSDRPNTYFICKGRHYTGITFTKRTRNK